MKGMTRKLLLSPTVNTTSCTQAWLQIPPLYFKENHLKIQDGVDCEPFLGVIGGPAALAKAPCLFELLIDTSFNKLEISLFGTLITASIVNSFEKSHFHLRRVKWILSLRARWLNLACHQLPAFVAVFTLVFPPCFPVGNKLDFQI